MTGELKTIGLTCGHSRVVSLGLALLCGRGFIDRLRCLRCEEERPVDVGAEGDEPG